MSVLEVGLEYTKELRQLQNDYPLVSDKIEINRKMLSGINEKLLINTIFLLIRLKN